MLVKTGQSLRVTLLVHVQPRFVGGYKAHVRRKVTLNLAHYLAYALINIVLIVDNGMTPSAKHSC